MDLILAQGQALERREDRRDARDRSAHVVRSLIRHERRELTERRQSATLASGVATAMGAIAALVRAVGAQELPVAWQNIVTVLAVTFGLIALTAGAIAALLKWRADRLEEQIEEVADLLGERQYFLDIVREIGERVDGRGPPWTVAQLRDAIAEWSTGEDAARGTVAALVLEIGPREFMRLLVAKGAELGLLAEEVQAGKSGHVVLYRLTVPELAGSDAQG